MKRRSTIVAVASGKGGVGKSLLAVNLAEALAAAGSRTALVDADAGQGDCAVLLNEAPKASVLDAVLRTAAEADVPHRTATGITLVQAAREAGRADGHEIDLYAALDGHLRHLRATHDVVLIDAPAGAEGAVRWALDRADLGVLVLVGEPTAVAGAYRLAKLVWQSDPAYPLAAVVNFADTEAEARSVAERFGRVTEPYLGRVPAYLGWVPFSADVRRSVAAQTPAVRTPGPAAEAFHTLAHVLRAGRPSPAGLPLPGGVAAVEEG